MAVAVQGGSEAFRLLYSSDLTIINLFLQELMKEGVTTVLPDRAAGLLTFFDCFSLGRIEFHAISPCASLTILGCLSISRRLVPWYTSNPQQILESRMCRIGPPRSAQTVFNY
jgi:hypothetical protein